MQYDSEHSDNTVINMYMRMYCGINNVYKFSALPVLEYTHVVANGRRERSHQACQARQ